MGYCTQKRKKDSLNHRSTGKHIREINEQMRAREESNILNTVNQQIPNSNRGESKLTTIQPTSKITGISKYLSVRNLDINGINH